MKKLFILLLFAVVVTSTPVWAAENPVSIDGYIYDETGTTITVRDGEERAVLNITPETIIVDASDGMPLALAERNDDHVIVYHSGGSALVILGNVPDTGMRPQFGRVEAIETRDDEVVITVHGGSLLVTIGRDSQIEPFMTRNLVTIDHIEVGSDLLMWYPLVAASYPGQATAQRTIILSHGTAPEGVEYNGYANGYGNGNGYANGYNGYGNGYANGYNGYNGYENGNGYANGYNGYYNGQANGYTPAPPTAVMSLADALNMVYSDFYTENNITMVPLRQVAESMGFNVTWNENYRSVTLEHADGQAFGSVILGQHSFESHNLEVAPTIRNDRTFVPVSFFEILLGM